MSLALVLHATPEQLMSVVQKCLTDDLLTPKMRRLKDAKRDSWALRGDKVFGHCYVASEALLYLLRERGDAGWYPVCLAASDTPDREAAHWYLERDTHELSAANFPERLDPTSDQFRYKPVYMLGRRKGFLTKKPSKRAEELIRRVKNRMIDW